MGLRMAHLQKRTCRQPQQESLRARKTKQNIATPIAQDALGSTEILYSLYPPRELSRVFGWTLSAEQRTSGYGVPVDSNPSQRTPSVGSADLVLTGQDPEVMASRRGTNRTSRYKIARALQEDNDSSESLASV